MTETQRWKFFRAGGFDQVWLENGSDLLSLSELDQKLWAALNCPTRGIEFEPRTLALLDRDQDGHIRASDILDAAHWLGGLLIDAAQLAEGRDGLRLTDINTTTDEGVRIQSSVRHLLKTLGKSENDQLTLADMQDIEQRLAGLEFNGDGVIYPAQIADTGLRGVVETLLACLPGVADLSGNSGVDESAIETFFSDAAHSLDWYRTGLADPAIFPLGENTEAAFAAWQAVAAKIDDYVLRCQMAAYDNRATAPLSRAIEDYAQVAAGALSAETPAIAEFPIALVSAGKSLALDDGINPAWKDKIADFQEQVVRPLLGERTLLSFADWQMLSATFRAHAQWLSHKPAGSTASLSMARLQEIFAEGAHETALRSLLAQDKAVEEEVKSVRSVERLLCLRRDLFVLANNFVSFRNFYTGKGKAVFQIGTLYLDGRSCDLCVRVDDINRHAAFANSSGICLVYCECVRNGGSEKTNIAAAFTAGDSDFLVTGRNGMFYDRQGSDWNASIVRILDHPISIHQAFWSPYKKLGKLVSEQLQKFAASKASTVEGKIIKAVVDNGKAATESPATAAKPPFDVAKFAGIFAAIGLAIGAIGGIVASIVSGILGLKLWQIPLALAGLVLLISGPSMVLAWFKLKRRNLGPILDACGWAINARMQINIPFGTALTQMASLPPGAMRALSDPFAEKRKLWPYWLTGLVLLLAGVAIWLRFAGYL